MKNVVYALIVLMAIIHQDFWWWDNKTLVFGFMPLGLFYHALFSCMAAGVWAYGHQVGLAKRHRGMGRVG